MSECKRLSDEEKKELLDTVRKTLDAYLRTKEILAMTPVNVRLAELKLGAFVTLKKEGELRGCIGNFSSRDALQKNIQCMSIASATGDPRFRPVTHGEFKDLKIEISVLYPLVPVKEIAEIEVGRDGLYICLGRCSGVLLPQVAKEYGWDRDEFLCHTCVKAGLHPDTWKQRRDIQIYRFEADVFSEDSL